MNDKNANQGRSHSSDKQQPKTSQKIGGKMERLGDKLSRRDDESDTDSRDSRR